MKMGTQITYKELKPKGYKLGKNTESENLDYL